jgi:hypothetical protein
MQEGVAAAVIVFDKCVSAIKCSDNRAAMLRPWLCALLRHQAGDECAAVAFIGCRGEFNVVADAQAATG